MFQLKLIKEKNHSPSICRGRYFDCRMSKDRIRSSNEFLTYVEAQFYYRYKARIKRRWKWKYKRHKCQVQVRKLDKS